MNEQDCKSTLQLDYLYFPEMNLQRLKTIGQTVLDVNYGVQHTIENYVANVEITTIIKAKNDSINLTLKAVGHFTLSEEAKDFDTKTKEEILRYSTVTIMMPYIRSQVSIITTQPDMTPIMLQPIDITRLMAQKEEKLM